MKDKVVTSCVQCNRRFTVGVLELEYLRTLGLDLPEYCDSCRKREQLPVGMKEKKRNKDKKKYFRRKYEAR